MKRSCRSKRAFGSTAVRLLAAAAGLCLATTTWAQQAATASPAASQQTGPEQLQEVVVTAERRTENLQTTPIAATVLDSDELVQKAVLGIQDLQTAAPSLSITPAGLSQNVNIRGIGLDSGSPSVVPGVALYRDGLWQPPIVTTDSFYDIGSVQVLRGPQGTFVGENSTGGAVIINSRDPDFEGLHGNVEAFGGNYSDWGLQGAVNLPISDTWAARVASYVESRDSFYSDIGSQLTPSPELFNHPGSLDEKNVRLGLRGKPSSDLDILFKVEVNDKSTGGYAYRPVPGTEYASFANPDPWTLDYDHYTLNDELGVRASLKIDWNIADSGIVLRSITGDQFMRVHNVEDTDGTTSTLPGPPELSTTQAIIERPESQEFNLISPNTGRLQWVVGSFYLHDIREIALNLQSQAVPQNVYPFFTQYLQTAAAFGQVSYEIVPRVKLQVGMRYTHDWNEVPRGGSVTIDFPAPPPLVLNSSGIETDSATTGKVALDWTVNDSNFLYVFAAKGFKAGGFNAGSATTPQTNFAPEVVWDYELGWKAEYLQHHLRTSLDAFWDNYTNLQVGALNPNTGQASLINTGKSTIKGVESELHGQFGGLNVDAGGAYVNSRLGAITLVNTELLPPGAMGPQCTGAALPPTCTYYNQYTVSLSGDQNPFSPEWTFNAGLQYAIPAGPESMLTPRINYSYVGSQWTTLFERYPTDHMPGFGLWSATVTYGWKEWSIQAYGLNLANRLYVAGQFAPGTNPDNEFFGNPRQFGLRVSRSF